MTVKIKTGSENPAVYLCLHARQRRELDAGETGPVRKPRALLKLRTLSEVCGCKAKSTVDRYLQIGLVAQLSVA